MAGKRRTKVQRENDLQTLASMYLRGYSQSFIAKHLGISQPQISLDLQKLYRMWRESAVMDFNEAKQRELHRIDVLEREYWRAWRESKVTKQRTRTAQIDEAGAKRISAQVDKEDRTGDPRYLAGVQWCIEQRAKILGINAPVKVAPTNPSGDREFTGLTDDERVARINDLLERARARRDGQSVVIRNQRADMGADTGQPTEGGV